VPRAELPGVTINYLKLGDWASGQAPLVLVHGLAASSGFWLPSTDLLTPHRPVLIYDLRGHGRSSMPSSGYTAAAMADDLVALLDWLEIEKCAVVGHSYGGGIALRVALNHPDRVRALVLADTRIRLFQPALTPAAWPHWQERREALREAGLDIPDDHPDAGIVLLTEMARRQTAPADAPPPPRWITDLFGQGQSRQMAARWLDLVDTTDALREFADETDLDIARLQTLRVSTLALYGGHSPVLPSGVALHEMLPNIQWTILPEAGHFFPVWKPVLFSNAVNAQLADG